MFEFIHEGGPFMILILLIVIGLLVLTIKKVIDLYVKKEQITIKDESAINAILFWGCISALLGILGQITGIYLAINEIAMASDISPQIVFMGLRVSFNSTLFGLWVLLFSSIIWFVLKSRYRKLLENK